VPTSISKVATTASGSTLPSSHTQSGVYRRSATQPSRRRGASRKNQTLRRWLVRVAAQPDDRSQEWWDDFQRSCAHLAGKRPRTVMIFWAMRTRPGSRPPASLNDSLVAADGRASRLQPR
jgi:hypothetical protein